MLRCCMEYFNFTDSISNFTTAETGKIIREKKGEFPELINRFVRFFPKEGSNFIQFRIQIDQRDDKKIYFL